jgi:hypothetical protein
VTHEEKVDGHEAHRDDPDYTAPEMEPGNGEDLTARPNPEDGIVAATAMTMPAAGGALAGTVLVNEVEEEIVETRVNPDPGA